MLANWGGDALRRRCTAVLNAAGGHTTFDFDPPLCSGTHYCISVSHMSVELVQFMSQVLNLVMFKFAENKRS